MINKKDIQFLKSKIDKDPVTIRFKDGEVVSADIAFVSERENDVIYFPLSSNRERQKKDAGIRATLDEIDSVS